MDPDAPWEIEDPSESAPEEVVPPEATEEAPAEVPPEELPPPPEELTEAQRRKKLICRHWIRPKFLQYTYMYNYRKNYYDDYINYLDRRNRGLTTDVPRAQTWAERALRTYTHKFERANENIQRAKDQDILKRIKYVNTFHAVHSKDYYSRKYNLVKY